MELWYKQPADAWVEALPVGNGRLGAMVFGRVDRERIHLNEESVWTGQPTDLDRAGAYEFLPEVRRLLFAEEYAAAEKLVHEQFMAPGPSRSYQTLGDLWLQFPHGAALPRPERRCR